MIVETREGEFSTPEELSKLILETFGEVVGGCQKTELVIQTPTSQFKITFECTESCG